MSRTSLVLLAALMCVARVPAQDADPTKGGPTDKEFYLEVEEGGNNKTETTLKLIVTMKGERKCSFRVGTAGITTAGRAVAGKPDLRVLEALVKLELRGAGNAAQIQQSLKFGPGEGGSVQTGFPAPGITSLEKALKLEAKTGRFTLGKKHTLGVIRGETVTLTVE